MHFTQRQLKILYFGYALITLGQVVAEAVRRLA